MRADYLNKKNLLKFLIAIFAIFVSLVLVEILLHKFYSLRYGYQYYLWPPYTTRSVTAPPDVFPGVSGTKRFLINSIGMRGDEPSYDDKMRILALGGSTTESGELDETETWPYLLQKKLNEDSEQKIWVGNAGRRGSTTRDNILQFKYFVSQIKNIDTIILLPGINDFMLSISTEYKPFDLKSIDNPSASQMDHAFSVHPYSSYGFKGTAIWSLIKQAKVATIGRKLIEDNEGKSQTFWRDKRQNAKEILDQLPDLTKALNEYETNLNMTIDMTKSVSPRIILLTQPTIYKDEMPQAELVILWFGCIDQEGWKCYSPKVLKEGMEKFNERTLDVCKKRNVECIDLATTLPKNTSIFLDDVHFNENGSREVAKIISNYLDNSQKN